MHEYQILLNKRRCWWSASCGNFINRNCTPARRWFVTCALYTSLIF
jgi:hypothetical protein